MNTLKINHNTLRSLLFSFLLLASLLSFGQNSYLNLGYRGNGLGIGNSENYNGIRLNLVDRNVNLINGINLSLISKYQQTNGLRIAFHSISKETNGINIAVWGMDDSVSNGLSIATGIGGYKINGAGIGLLGVSADTINGFFFTGLIGTSSWSTDQIDVVNGVTIGVILGVQAEELNGMAVGVANSTERQKGFTLGLFNRTKELSGVQVGLWNVAENNWFFKRMPLINFNFRKKQESTD